MQNPTMKTPNQRCAHLGRFSGRMLGKFPTVQALVDFAKKMTALTAAFEQSTLVYEQSKLVIVEARADVRFADFTTDNEIGNLIRRVQLAENQAAGPILKTLAPEGKTPLVKPFGQAQVDVLIDLEGTLDVLLPTWPAAAQEIATFSGLRKSYQDALQIRKDAWQTSRNLRVARNVAKQAFIKGYVEISFGVKALYAQDKKMQELFFDEVEADVEKDLGDEPPDPQTGAPAAAPAPAGHVADGAASGHDGGSDPKAGP